MSAGVLVLHPWWGLNDDVRGYVERLRGEGYKVGTPDLYHGRVATTVDGAKALMVELGQNSKGAMTEIDEALTKLSAQADRGGARLEHGSGVRLAARCGTRRRRSGPRRVLRIR